MSPRRPLRATPVVTAVVALVVLQVVGRLLASSVAVGASCVGAVGGALDDVACAGPSYLPDLRSLLLVGIAVVVPLLVLHLGAVLLADATAGAVRRVERTARAWSSAVARVVDLLRPRPEHEAVRPVAPPVERRTPLPASVVLLAAPRRGPPVPAV